MTRRGYLSQAELAEYADITITDQTEADDQISQAEEIIDGYVGFQQKYIPDIISGKASSGSDTGFTLDELYKFNYPFINYFVGCMVEILGGAGQGQRKLITASNGNGEITTETFSPALDNTSFYRIYQIGKFPRIEDISIYNLSTPQTIYKQIPENVKRAVAAQVEYMINMGAKYFSTDASEKTAESIGDYSYSKGKAAQGNTNLIAPKAKIYLKHILNRLGQIII
jgi:hypothetical protein